MDHLDSRTQKKIETFCRKHNIQRLAFFGSAIRDDFGPQSDIDILVEFEPGQAPGFGFFLIEEEMSQMMGRKVDLQTANFLSPDIRQVALTEIMVAYE